MHKRREEFLTVREVAARLKLHQETVRIWLRDGQLKGTRIGSDTAGWRVPESEVQRVLKTGRQRADTEGE